MRYPIYRMMLNPHLRIAITSYNQDMADKFSRRARAVARRMGVALSEECASIGEWETVEGGGLMARGVGAGVTGNGFDLIIVDDPIKSRDEAESESYRNGVWEWYTNDLYTRLEPNGAIAIIMTRWHEDDLVGRILASEDAARWAYLNLPALAEEHDLLGRAVGEALCPDRFTADVLRDIKRVMGSYAFNALYQGHPSPPEGTLLRRDWWQRYNVRPTKFDVVLASWDCTFKALDDSDFVVGQVWGKLGADFYLLDQVRGRMGFIATKQAIKDLKNKWPQIGAILIEDKANGTAVIEALKHEISGLIPVEPAGGKIVRVQAISPSIEAGNVYIPAQADWVNDFIEECAVFPNGANDDQVDSMSQSLTRLLQLYGEKPVKKQYVPPLDIRERIRSIGF